MAIKWADAVERSAPLPADPEIRQEYWEAWEREEEYEVACVRHKHAMRWLRDLFPEVGEEHHTRPCPCGRGALAMWPWVVQTKQLGFCDCDMASWERICWRTEWIRVGYPSLRWQYVDYGPGGVNIALCGVKSPCTIVPALTNILPQPLPHPPEHWLRF